MTGRWLGPPRSGEADGAAPVDTGGVSGEAARHDGGLDRVRARLTSAVERGAARAEAARDRWTAVDAVFDTRDRDRRVVGNVLAGAVAFRLFVYLLPLMLAVVTVLGIAVGLDPDSPSDLGDRLGLSRYVVDSVTTTSQESHRSLWILVPLTLWAIYTGGVGAARVLHAAHALAWDRPVERLARPALAALVAFGIALGVVASVGTLQALREESEGLGLGFVVLEVAVLVGLALVVDLVLPRHPATRPRDLLPGAVLVGVGLWLLHVVSAYFLSYRIASASELYGSLGVAAALLAWLFLLGRLLVGAPILNATLWYRRQPPRMGEDSTVVGDRP